MTSVLSTNDVNKVYRLEYKLRMPRRNFDAVHSIIVCCEPDMYAPTHSDALQDLPPDGLVHHRTSHCLISAHFSSQSRATVICLLLTPPRLLRTNGALDWNSKETRGSSMMIPMKLKDLGR